MYRDIISLVIDPHYLRKTVYMVKKKREWESKPPSEGEKT